MSEYKIEDINKLSINLGEWWQNDRIIINKKVIEKTIKELELKLCPICERDLNWRDQFGTNLYTPRDRETEFRHCPTEDYIIELVAHQYRGNTWGTNFIMRIYTNAKFSKKLADSGILADLKEQHVRLK